MKIAQEAPQGPWMSWEPRWKTSSFSGRHLGAKGSRKFYGESNKHVYSKLVQSQIRFVKCSAIKCCAYEGKARQNPLIRADYSFLLLEFTKSMYKRL